MFNFFSSSPELIILQMAAMAAQRYTEQRLDHYQTHGIEIDGEDAGSLVWVTQSEVRALLTWVDEHVEDHKYPEELCPFLSELASMCRPDTAFEIRHVGPASDPNLN